MSEERTPYSLLAQIVERDKRIAALEAENAEAKALLGELNLEWLWRDDDDERGSYRSGPRFAARRDALLNPTPEPKETTDGA